MRGVEAPAPLANENVVHGFELEHFAADLAGEAHPDEEHQDQGGEVEGLAHGHHQHQGDQHQGQGQEDVHDAHEQLVNEAAKVAGDEAQAGADGATDAEGYGGDNQGDASAVNHAAEDVAARSSVPSKYLELPPSRSTTLTWPPSVALGSMRRAREMEIWRWLRPGSGNSTTVLVVLRSPIQAGGSFWSARLPLWGVVRSKQGGEQAGAGHQEQEEDGNAEGEVPTAQAAQPSDSLGRGRRSGCQNGVCH